MIHNEGFAHTIKRKLETFPTTLNLSISAAPVRKTRFQKIKKLIKQPKRPWELAQEWQALHGTVSLDVLIEDYLDTGYIWSMPNLFMLAKEVYWDSDKKEISKDDKPNAWFVGIGSTKDSHNPVKELIQKAPHPLEWVVWMRRNQYKAYKWKYLAAKVKL
jgi:hypothetical protein